MPRSIARDKTEERDRTPRRHRASHAARAGRRMPAAAVAPLVFLFFTLWFMWPVIAHGETFASSEANQERTYPWAGVNDTIIEFGQPGDQALVGDWDGDGIDSIGVFRGTEFLLLDELDSDPADPRTVRFGKAGDVAVAGDWDGDGADSIGVFREGTFLLLDSLDAAQGAVSEVEFGQAGDIPVIGDWDGDGIDSFGVWRDARFVLDSGTEIDPTTVFSPVVYAPSEQYPVGGKLSANGLLWGTYSGTRLSFLYDTPDGPQAQGYWLTISSSKLLVGSWGESAVGLALFNGERFVLKTEAVQPLLVHFDQAETFQPWQVALNRQVDAGEIPWWNEDNLGGTPYALNGQSGALYPPRLVLSKLMTPNRAHDWLVGAHLFVAGLAMYGLCRSVNRSRASAILAGTGWMLATFAVAWTALDHVIAQMVFMPLAFLAVEMVLRKRNTAWSGVLSLVIATMFLVANVLWGVVVLLVVGGYIVFALLWSLVSAWRSDGARSALHSTAKDGVRLGAGVGAGLLGSAVVLLPAWVLGSEAVRQPPSYEEIVTKFDLDERAIGTLWRMPDVASDYGFLFDYYHEVMFVGTAVFFAALVGVFAFKRLAIYAAVAAVASVLVMQGTAAYRIFYLFVPEFASIKPLGRLIFVTDFLICVLCAFGLDNIGALARRAVRLIMHREPTALRTVGVAIAGVLVVLTGAQLVGAARQVLPAQSGNEASLYPSTGVSDALSGGDRFIPLGTMFTGSTSLAAPELDSIGGYESLVSSRQSQVQYSLLGWSVEQIWSFSPEYALYTEYRPDWARIDLAARSGASLVVAPPNISQEIGDGLLGEPFYDGPDGTIWPIVNAPGRARIVTGCHAVSSERESLEAFFNSQIDPNTTVIVESDQLASPADCEAAGAQSGGSATVVDDGNSTVVLVDVTQSGWLVLSDTWSQGWSVTVDDEAAEIVRADHAFRAVRVEPGSHAVEFRYVPPGLRAGLALTGIGLILSFAMILGSTYVRLRRRSSPATREQSVIEMDTRPAFEDPITVDGQHPGS